MHPLLPPAPLSPLNSGSGFPSCREASLPRACQVARNLIFDPANPQEHYDFTLPPLDIPAHFQPVGKGHGRVMAELNPNNRSRRGGHSSYGQPRTDVFGGRVRYHEVPELNYCLVKSAAFTQSHKRW